MFVRQALMILPTLPRVIGPDEQFSLPVSVFTSDASIKSVKLEVQTDARFTPVGSAARPRSPSRVPKKSSASSRCASGSTLGKGKIHVIATSGKFRAENEVWLEVRTPNVSSSRFQRATLAPGQSWTGDLTRFRTRGTQVANLEVSALPPVNLDGRLEYLIHYPHGCLEQTTSSVFPQLYLPALIKLDQNRRLAGGEQHPRGPRAPAQPAAPERRLRLLARPVEHRTAIATGATTGARPTPATSCWKPKRRATRCPAT